MTAVYQLTDAGTITPDFTVAQVDMGQNRAVLAVTLGGNRTLANPVGARDGLHMVLRVTQDATGGRTLTFGSAFNFSSTHSRPAPVLSTSANTSLEMVFGYYAFGQEWWLVGGPNLIQTSDVLLWPGWS